MSVIAYLNFNGNAAEAIDYYAEALQASRIRKVQFKDIPQDPNYPLPERERDMIMEASIEFAGGQIMLSDILPSMQAVTGEWVQGNQMLISIVIEDHEALKRYFDRLSAGGHILMPLSNTPWSSCFGMLADRFGVGWKFNSDADKFLDRVLAMKQSQ